MPPLTEEQLQELLSLQFGNRGIASLSQAASPLSFQFEDAFTPYSPRQMLALETMRLPGTEYPFGYGTEDPAFFSDFTMGYNFDPYKGTKEDFNYLDGTRPGFQYDTSGAINEISTKNKTPGMFLDDAGLPAIDTSFGVANEPDDEEDVKKAKRSRTGIGSLINFLQNIPTPLNLLRKGIESLSGFNQRIRNTDFGRSSTLSEFLQRRRDRKAREEAARRGAEKQKAIIAGQQVDPGGGPGNRPGGFGTGAGSFRESEPTATEGSF